MKAIILAGGKGTRLRPYTTAFPKPLVPLGHQPIIDIIISQLAHYGFRDIVLMVGYLAELIQAYFQHVGERFDGVNLTYIKEKAPMGTAGCLPLVPDLRETFLVMNGDILTTMDYAGLVAFHKSRGGILTIGVHKKKVAIDLGVLEMDGEGFLTNYVEKPQKEYSVSMGIYVYEPEVLKYIPKNGYFDFPDLVLKLLESGERVAAYPCNEFWLDIGRHEDYERAQEVFENMKHRFLPGHSFEDRTE